MSTKLTVSAGHGVAEGDRLRLHGVHGVGGARDYVVTRVDDAATITVRRARWWWPYALAALAGLAAAALICASAFLTLWWLS